MIEYILPEKAGLNDSNSSSNKLRNIINSLLDLIGEEAVLICEVGHYFGKVSGIFKGHFKFEATSESACNGEEVYQSDPALIKHNINYGELKEIKVPFDKFENIDRFEFYEKIIW